MNLKKLTFSKSFLNQIAFCFFILFESCTYNDLGQYAKPTCDCQSPVTSSYSSLPSISINTTEGFLLLNTSRGFLKPCFDLDSSLQVDGLIVISNGRIKQTCFREGDVSKYEKKSFVLIDKWDITKDSSFNSTEVEIHLLRTEDYGYSLGFGYKITTSSGLKILQPTIPAFSGNKVFKTPSDALKVAILVAYKINLNIGLPAISLEDLYYLKIDLS